MTSATQVSPFARWALRCGLAAIGSLVLGVVAYQPVVLLGFFGLGLAAFVLGITALIQIRKSGGTLVGKGRATWGIVLAPCGFLGGALMVPAT